MKILIWGTGAISKQYMKFDLFSGHEIVGFVDSYRREEMFMNYKVYLPNEILQLDYDSIIVCISKNNAEILKVCIEKHLDLSKIFFVRAEQGFIGIENKYVDKLMSKEEALQKFPIIFRYEKEQRVQNDYINDISVLEKDLKASIIISNIGESHVVVWIPIELIFSEKTADCYPEDCTDAWLQQNAKWENHPIISFEPYRNLFNFLMNGERYPVDYCEWYQNLFLSRGIVSGLSDEQLISKRLREFRIMRHELNNGMQFFIEHPATAKWNKKGYFNLIDGHHRVSFLYYSGMGMVPVQISSHDYKIWCNEYVAKEVHNIILEQGRTEFYQPILNPFFLSIHSHREGYVKSRLHHILEYFNEKRFVGKKVIDIGSNLGYMGQAFCRMGAEVTLLEPDAIHYELAMRINELLYTPCKVVTQKFEEYETDEEYDVAILLTVFYHYFDKKKIRDLFIAHLNKYVAQMIIWESGDKPEMEKSFILKNTKFSNYKHLCYTYATGKFRELGIFYTNDSEYI